MAENDTGDHASGDAQRDFVRRVLEDVQALETMIARGVLESGVRRVGAEQEVFLIDPAGAPAPVAADVIGSMNSPLFTSEWAPFSVQVNLPPMTLEDRCLSGMAATLHALLERVRAAAAAHGADALLAGILPTLRASDLVPRDATPGNCGFHVHLQVGSEEFPRIYNAAQAFAAPVLAAATNSPFLLGKRLWHETRIALLQQEADTRGPETGRAVVPRVTFGAKWVERSVLEIYREDIARFRPILGGGDDESPIEVLLRGGIPKLSALRHHNGTVWHWNRPCYGINDGRPHLRIENRILPSGPTVEDQIGNAALWLGLMRGAIARELDVTRRMDFDEAHANFIAAARLGLDAQLHWFDGRTVPADRLLLDELIPFAYEGLRSAGVGPQDIDKFLGTVAHRVATRRTGSRWALDSLAAMETAERRGTPGQRLAALTKGMQKGQLGGRPVHEWSLARLEDAGVASERDAPVEQYMSPDVFTVRPDDPIELAAHLMDLRGVHEVPVEDDCKRLVGIVSHAAILRLVARGGLAADETKLPVSSIMDVDPVAVTPSTRIVEAIDTMVKHDVSGLPVVHEGKLVGIVSERDLLRIAGELFFERLSSPRTMPARRRAARPLSKRAEL